MARIARIKIIHGEKLEAASKVAGVSYGYVKHANVVLDHAPDLGGAVLSGVTTLADAYEKAKLVKEQASSETFRLDKLRATRSPLADKVAEGESKVSPEGWRKSAKWGSGPGRVSCKTPLPIPGLPFRDG